MAEEEREAFLMKNQTFDSPKKTMKKMKHGSCCDKFDFI
jgi:hypothetical protein